MPLVFFVHRKKKMELFWPELTLDIDSKFELTLNIESIWLKYSPISYSEFRVEF